MSIHSQGESTISSTSTESSRSGTPELLQPSDVDEQENTTDQKIQLLFQQVGQNATNIQQACQNTIDTADTLGRFKTQFQNYTEFVNSKFEFVNGKFEYQDTKIENLGKDVTSSLDNLTRNLTAEIKELSSQFSNQHSRPTTNVNANSLAVNKNMQSRPSDTFCPASGEESIPNYSPVGNTSSLITNTNSSNPSSFIPISKKVLHPYQSKRPLTESFEKQTHFVTQQSQENVGFTKPANFDGKTSWTDYKIHFETVAMLNKWTNLTKTMKLIACLQDVALATLGDIDTENLPSYDDLINTLTKRFAPKNQTELYKTQIDSRIRKKGESLTDLAQDIKRLVRLAYPQAHQDIRESLACRSFRDALNDSDLEWALIQGNTDTIDESLNLALKYEAFHLSTKKPTLRQVSEDDSSGPRRTYESKTYTRNQNKGVCFYCGKPGHIRLYCDKRLADNDRHDYVKKLKEGHLGGVENKNQGQKWQNKGSVSNQGNC